MIREWAGRLLRRASDALMRRAIERDDLEAMAAPQPPPSLGEDARRMLEDAAARHASRRQPEPARPLAGSIAERVQRARGR